MLRHTVMTLFAVVVLAASAQLGQAQEYASGQVWGQDYGMHNMGRFYHYPYIYYPQNFWGSEYYRSAGMYYRYPPEMRIPVYNKSWMNYYPGTRRYHWGHHFLTDVF